MADLFTGYVREPEHAGQGLPAPRRLRAGPPGLRRRAHPERGQREYGSLLVRGLLGNHTGSRAGGGEGSPSRAGLTGDAQTRWIARAEEKRSNSRPNGTIIPELTPPPLQLFPINEAFK